MGALTAGDDSRYCLVKTDAAPVQRKLPPLDPEGQTSPRQQRYDRKVAHVPWGKPDSFISWGDGRFAVQYLSYFRFDSPSNNAAVNSALCCSVWAAPHS